MNKAINATILITLFLPAIVLAQDGTIPISDTTATASQAVNTSRAPTPTASTGSGITTTPTPISRQTPVLTPKLSPTPTETPRPIPATTEDETSNYGLIIGLIAGLSAIGGFFIFKAKTKEKKTDNGRCDSIKELLERKKKELEDFVQKWPEEKIKSLAKEKITDELKKDDDGRKIIETAESLQARHKKIKDAIELLQKRYDLCMLELPSLNKAKALKFKEFKANWILDGTKTSTIRLFDDKDLKAGDDLELIDSDNNKTFAKAKITEVIEKKLDELNDMDLKGHEKWDSHDEMIKSLKEYYGDKVNKDTPAKIIKFKLKDKKSDQDKKQLNKIVD